MIAEILERTRKARAEIGSFIADEVSDPHIAGMSLQDIQQLQIRPELYDELLVYAIDHGRSINGLVEEILTKDLPDVVPAVGLPDVVPEPAPELEPDVPRTTHVVCQHGGNNCPHPFRWRHTVRCGCPARRLENLHSPGSGSGGSTGV